MELYTSSVCNDLTWNYIDGNIFQISALGYLGIYFHLDLYLSLTAV